MNKLAQILSKISSSFRINFLNSENETSVLVGNWDAISYTEKLYENGELINVDDFSYDINNRFQIRFKKDDTFVQLEKTRGQGRNTFDESKKKGVYHIKEGELTLNYGNTFDEESVVKLAFSIEGKHLITINDYQRTDVGDVYRHLSKRKFERKF
ncbi:hypothetical protein HX109_05470 [Galbibacter sp. BG1]|uniref:hypothetical protein n=1 Tax=Galbibacter sp. BG1 TaxID=1170699 RepID=UPI0015BD26AB|nr:hypothetical protein [Galbibacter sp. BG1]QLE01039.1 hypothetical protein HX109_05470 [Galbibacter sp. BG1]